MKIVVLVGTALCGSFLCTSCATKKYVTRTIAPVESRVTATETKNANLSQPMRTSLKSILSRMLLFLGPLVPSAAKPTTDPPVRCHRSDW
jgi:hypothetical protein